MYLAGIEIIDIDRYARVNNLFVAPLVEKNKGTQATRALIENIEPARKEIHEQFMITVTGNR